METSASINHLSMLVSPGDWLFAATRFPLPQVLPQTSERQWDYHSPSNRKPIQVLDFKVNTTFQTPQLQEGDQTVRLLVCGKPFLTRGGVRIVIDQLKLIVDN
jgi:hypothetical protein